MKWLVSFVSLQPVYFLFPSQKVADEKGVKAKKGGARGKKEDGLAQNGDTKNNEVWTDPKNNFYL